MLTAEDARRIQDSLEPLKNPLQDELHKIEEQIIKSARSGRGQIVTHISSAAVPVLRENGYYIRSVDGYSPTVPMHLIKWGEMK